MLKVISRPQSLAVAERDAAARQIVRRELYHHPISWQYADVVLAHFTAKVTWYRVLLSSYTVNRAFGSSSLIFPSMVTKFGFSRRTRHSLWRILYAFGPSACSFRCAGKNLIGMIISIAARCARQGHLERRSWLLQNHAQLHALLIRQPGASIFLDRIEEPR